MDGTGYLTLQFGLDERFGDGNASQIGLELDEDLFSEDNHLTSQHVSSTMAPDESAVHQSQTSYSVPPTHMDIDDDQNGLVKDIDIEASQDLSNLHERHVHPSMVHEKMNNVSSQWQGYNIQTPDLNEVFSPTDHIEGPSAAPSKIIIGSTADEVPSPDLAEGAHAPSTPGLMEEIFSANIHESPALSPQQKPSPSIGEETIRPENSNIHFECPDLVTDDGAMHSVTVAPDSANIMQVVSSPTSELSERREQITTPDETQMGCGQKSVSELQDGYVCSQVKDLTVDKQAQYNGEAILSEVAQPSSCCSVEHVEDVNPCYNGDASAVSSDLHFRPCTSLVNQANALSAQDGALTQKVPVVSVEEPCVPSQTSVQENKLHASESSFEMQGKDSHMANSTNAELEVQENPQDVSTESALFASNTNELLADLSKNDTQRNELNCSSRSEFPEPEKMLLAPTGDVEQANELSQVTEEKGVVESDGSVDRMTSLSGKKRHLMETTSALLNGSSGKMSGRSRLRRNTENVPDDDDLLASILVGKRTPLLKIGPTPPPPKATSLKRPWLAPRLRMPKRKVLLDDTTVLHADAIRQQLMNTEDIRRMRKKAPCTRPEIWMIQQSSLEDEIFNEPIVTGISAQLNGLHVQRYDSETNQNNSRDEPPKEYDPSRNLEFVREANETEKTELILVMPENVDVETPGPSRVSLPTKVQSSKDMEVCDDQEQSVPALPLLDQSGDDGQCMMLTTEISVKDKISGADTPMPLAAPAPSRLECEVTATDSTADDLVQTRDNSSVVNGEALHVTENASAEDLAFADGDSKGRVVDNNAFAIVNDDPTMHVEEVHTATDASIVDRSMMSLDAITLNDPQDICRAAKRVNSDALVSELYNISRECEAGLATDSSTIVHEGDMSLQDVVRESGATDPLAVTGNLIVDEREGVGAKVENKALVQKLMHNEGNLNTDVSCSEGEGPGTVSVSLTQTTTETEIVPPAVFGSTPMDMAIAKECSDFCSAIDGNDTEFLNIDDETDYHEGDNDVPNAEDAALENSGWSSRTRNVARYLKGWFDEASGLGRKSVAMDHLIAGRTRKEASRMFFETLILKTKDYIHVEQENPANYIIIRPRAKLLKAEF